MMMISSVNAIHWTKKKKNCCWMLEEETTSTAAAQQAEIIIPGDTAEEVLKLGGASSNLGDDGGSGDDIPDADGGAAGATQPPQEVVASTSLDDDATTTAATASGTNNSSRVWWWGVLFLSMGLFFLPLLFFSVTDVRPRTVEGWNTSVKGNWGRAVAISAADGILFNAAAIVLLTLLVRDACRIARRKGRASKRAVYAVGALPGPDRLTWLVAGKWIFVSGVGLTVGIAILGQKGFTPLRGVTILALVFYWLPRAAARWLAEEGENVNSDHKQRARKLTSFVARFIFISFPITFLQVSLEKLLAVMSADHLSLLYPYTLSVVEAVVIARVFHDNAVRCHTDEALGAISRWFIAGMEAARTGLIVVVYTSGAGTLPGVIFAILNSAVVESMSRSGMFAMLLTTVNKALEEKRVPLRLTPCTTMGRFERVHLGSKSDVELWPIYMLAVIGILDYHPRNQANDPDTGELLHALRPGPGVFALLLMGELLTNACTYSLMWAIARWWPDLDLELKPVRPRCLSVMLLNWWCVGNAMVTGISSVGGGVVEELQKITDGE